MKIVLRRLQDANLKVVPVRRYFDMIEVKHLRHIVNIKTSAPTQGKVQAVQDIKVDTPQPETMSQLIGLLGLSGYYRAFYKEYAHMVPPLTELTKKGTDMILERTPECNAAIKDRLANAPILRRPEQVDWQPNGVAATLSQTGNKNREHVIASASKKLSGSEHNWIATDREYFGACGASRRSTTSFMALDLFLNLTIRHSCV